MSDQDKKHRRQQWGFIIFWWVVAVAVTVAMQLLISWALGQFPALP